MTGLLSNFIERKCLADPKRLRMHGYTEHFIAMDNTGPTAYDVGWVPAWMVSAASFIVTVAMRASGTHAETATLATDGLGESMTLVDETSQIERPRRTRKIGGKNGNSNRHNNHW